jgi:hypothetical protein
MFRFGGMALVLALTLVVSSEAQTVILPVPGPSSLHGVRIRGPLSMPGLVFPADTVRGQIQPSHWLEGGLVGAGVLGVLTAFLGHELCANSEASEPGCAGELILGAAIGGAVGFGLGALIGGQFPTRAQVDSADVGS